MGGHRRDRQDRVGKKLSGGKALNALSAAKIIQKTRLPEWLAESVAAHSGCGTRNDRNACHNRPENPGSEGLDKPEATPPKKNQN